MYLRFERRKVENEMFIKKAHRDKYISL